MITVTYTTKNLSKFVILVTAMGGVVGCKGSIEDNEQVAGIDHSLDEEIKDEPTDEEIEDLYNTFKERFETEEVSSPEDGVSGEVGNAALAFFPDDFDFGNVSVGSDSPGSIMTLYNSSDYSIYVGGISLTSSNTYYSITANNCSPAVPLEPSSSCTISVKVNPGEGGTIRASIKALYGLESEEADRFSTAADFVTSGVSDLSFAGLDSISGVTGSSLTLNWTHVVGAVNYYVYRIDAGTPTLLSSVASPVATYEVKDLNISTTYTFRVRALDGSGIPDGNINDLSASTLANPRPTVSGVSPNAGALAGSTTVTITGTGFLAGITAIVGGSACTTPTFISSTSMSCTLPSQSAGTYDIVVTNSDSQTGTGSNLYTYQIAPAIGGVTPASGSWEGGTELTISGSGFLSGAAVTVGGDTCTGVSVDSATQITCTSPARSAGATAASNADLAVTNSDTQTDTLVSGFTYKYVESEKLTGAMYPYGCHDDEADRAQFRNPSHLHADGGFLYVADNTGGTIRKVSIADGTTTTLSGKSCRQGNTNSSSGDGRLIDPWGVVKLGSYLYVTQDSYDNIRRIDLSTGNVEDYAGSYNAAANTDGALTTARFNRPIGITTDGTHLYVADYSNHRIRKIDVSLGTVSTFAGSSAGYLDDTGVSARFNAPIGIEYVNVAGTDYLFVVELGNDRIRRINIATQVVDTFAGSGTQGHVDAVGTAARFYNPYDITSDGTYLYVAAQVYDVIRRIRLSDASVDTIVGASNIADVVNDIGSDARLYAPVGLAVDGTDLYFTDSSQTIRKVDLTTNTVSTHAGLYQEGRFNNRTNGMGQDARFNVIYGQVKVGNSLYIADYNNHQIREHNLGTNTTTVFTGSPTSGSGSTDGVGTAALHRYPWGIASANGKLYVSNYDREFIQEIDINTQSVTLVAGEYGTPAATDGAGTAARFNNPRGIATDSAGTYLYIADYSNHRIRRMDLATYEVTTIAGNGTASSLDGVETAATVYSPEMLVVNGTDLYFTSNSHLIRKIDLTTNTVSSLNINTAGYADNGDIYYAQFRNPKGLAADGIHLYISDYYNHGVRKYEFATGAVTTITANLLPQVSVNTSYYPMRNATGDLSSGTAIAYPWAIDFDSSYGLIVTNPYGVYRIK